MFFCDMVCGCIQQNKTKFNTKPDARSETKQRNAPSDGRRTAVYGVQSVGWYMRWYFLFDCEGWRGAQGCVLVQMDLEEFKLQVAQRDPRPISTMSSTVVVRRCIRTIWCNCLQRYIPAAEEAAWCHCDYRKIFPLESDDTRCAAAGCCCSVLCDKPAIASADARHCASEEEDAHAGRYRRSVCA